MLARLGDYEGAIASYEAAMRLKPELTPILLNLGIAHYRAGQFAKAVEVLGRFLAVAPDHAQARQLVGVSLVELGRDAEAITYLEPALSSSQTETTALYSLGLAYLRSRRGDVADVAKRLAAREDGAALSRLLQGQAHLEEFAFEKAATELKRRRRSRRICLESTSCLDWPISNSDDCRKRASSSNARLTAIRMIS